MTLLFTFLEQIPLEKSLVKSAGFKHGEWEWRYYPDEESYVRVLTSVKAKKVAILCSLNQPDEKISPLIFLAKTLRELGAKEITLIAPYLGYMRHDKRFKEGEAISSNIFAKLLSGYIDELITIDPHLHRHKTLEEIYSCKCRLLTAAPLIAQWIKTNVSKPLIIGPDMESEQWVKTVSQKIGAPYVILEKTRSGDRKVKISLPDISNYKTHIPVLVDDIISTAGTMIKTAQQLNKRGFKQIICVATHGVFVKDAYENLKKTSGIRIIASTNTIKHISNKIDITPLIVQAVKQRKL